MGFSRINAEQFVSCLNSDPVFACVEHIVKTAAGLRNNYSQNNSFVLSSSSDEQVSSWVLSMVCETGFAIDGPKMCKLIENNGFYVADHVIITSCSACVAMLGGASRSISGSGGGGGSADNTIGLGIGLNSEPGSDEAWVWAGRPRWHFHTIWSVETPPHPQLRHRLILGHSYTTDC